VNIAKTLIDKYSMSYEEVAYKVGVTSTAVRYWYNGTKKPIRITRTKLEELLAQAKSGNGQKVA